MDTSSGLDNWIETFPYKELVAELEDLQKRVQLLNTRLFALQDLKQMYERVRALQASGNAEPSPLPTQPLPPGHPPINPPTTAPIKPTLRDSIQVLMSDDPGRKWSSDELWEELTVRGWLRRDEQGKANMFAMLSTMTQQGQLERVKRGVYRVKVSAPVTDLLDEILPVEANR